MQRRPLDPIPFNEDDFLTPMDRLANIFFCQSNENSDIVCVQPLFIANSYDALFHMIGFDTVPVHPKGRKKVLYPPQAPEGEHPTGFLQLGAAVRSRKHVIFEMGDHTTLVRFDFKESFVEGADKRHYQIDELQLWDGGIRFDLDCEDETHSLYVKIISKIVSETVTALASEDYQKAKAEFRELDDVVRSLHALSDQAEAQHNAEMIGMERMYRGQQKTP